MLGKFKEIYGKFFEGIDYLKYINKDLKQIKAQQQNLLKLQINAYRQELLRDERYRHHQNLNRFEQQVFSQNGEDGILAEIFRRIGTQSKRFVEIGVGNGLENNTAFLLFQDWHGWWIDGDESSVNHIQQHFKKPISEGRLKIAFTFITAENIETLLQQMEVPAEFDLLSLDIDRNTYWIWAALPRLRPRVIVVEYNGSIPPSYVWKVDYAADRIAKKTIYYGASLKAYELLGRQYNYCLVGCDLNGINAFFVREDLCPGKFEEPFTAEQHFQPFRHFLVQRDGYPASFHDDD